MDQDHCNALVMLATACYVPVHVEGETRSPERNAMAARAVTRTYSAQRAERELEDLQLVIRARNGDTKAMDTLIRRYTGFVRLKSSS